MSSSILNGINVGGHVVILEMFLKLIRFFQDAVKFHLDSI